MDDKLFYSPDAFKDLMPHLDILSSEVAEQVSCYPLDFPQVRNEVIEKKMEFPPFIKAFYGFLFHDGNVPTQQDFFDYYIETTHDANVDFVKKDSNLLYALRARMFRTYPSLVRDLHFNKLVQETFCNCEVIYNMDLDYKYGIDLMVSRGPQHCAVNLYTETRRGMFFRGKKAHRHIPFQNVIPIELPVNLNNGIRCGEFKLYGPYHLDELESTLCHIFGIDSLTL